jgi:BMFP domain-containing protein YqiC
MGDHAWFHDPARDAAVRAAEDGRDRPLPTLGEAIAHPFADAAERSVEVSKTGEGQSGPRTERVTLEITHHGPESAADWEWKYHIRPRHIFESVRVVEETHFDDLAQVAMERDAAISERDKLQARVAELEAMWDIEYVDYSIDKLKQERDAAIERRDHLEEANRCLRDASTTGMILLHRAKAKAAAMESERDNLQARVAELEAKLAPDANAVGGSNHAKQAASGGGEQPRGWLTEEEREALRYASQGLREAGGISNVQAMKQIDSLLASSTPPEVVLPTVFSRSNLGDRLLVEQQVRQALATAGVAVKEVGK